jgi:sulfite reductase (NADPH) flavoprotein alpha-component
LTENIAKNAPIFVSIKERVRLNPTSSKETYHLVLDLENHDFQYEVGDCIGIYPTNDRQAVERILNALQLTGNETIADRQGQLHTFQHFLTHRANLEKVTKKVALSCGLDETTSHESDVALLLEKAPVKMQDLQPFVDALLPLMPRFYSIASSSKGVTKELHLTVALTAYEKEGEQKFGVCSRYICHMAPLNTPCVPIYLHKAKEFTLSQESHQKPIIMIGPGTGVAPFRGFLQERILSSKAPNWLFFGERNEKNDFYYKEFFQDLVKQGHLHLSTAFSRDQEEKLYVQHKMLENADQLWQWIHLKGAFIFVCGDASRMAKDVEAALLQIFQTHGKMDLQNAKEYLKTLRKDKRYLRDVY